MTHYPNPNDPTLESPDVPEGAVIATHPTYLIHLIRKGGGTDTVRLSKYHIEQLLEYGFVFGCAGVINTPTVSLQKIKDGNSVVPDEPTNTMETPKLPKRRYRKRQK